MKAFSSALGMLVCTTLLAAPGDKSEATLRTLSEKSYKGELISISEKEFEMNVAGKAEKFPFGEVIGIDLPVQGRGLQPETPYLQVRMIDGSMLKCQGLAIKGAKGKNVTLRLFSGLILTTDLRSIHWILCDAHDAKLRTAFEESLIKPDGQPPPGDETRVLSQNGAAIDEYEGFVNGADEKGNSLNANAGGGGAAINIAMARVRSIYLAQNQAARVPKPVCWVKDSGDNLFAAKKVESTADGYKITTVRDIEFEMPHSFVTQFDFTPGKIAWLSDVQPLRLEVTPILSGIKHYMRDKNLEGGPLSLGRKVYAKGLATHSQTILEYEVTGYNWFRCVVGIDDLVTGPAHAMVKIELDSTVLYNEPITNRDKPKELKLDISKQKPGQNARLRITVDYGKDLDLGDHVDFGDARVTK